MSRSDQPTGVRDCSVADALGVVGERWSLLVVRELSYGAHRFAEIQRRTGAPRDVLTARLRKLEAHGVLDRRRYSERPPRDEYLLTDAGRELAPVLLALKEWGDRHLHADAPPVVFEHTACGDPFHLAVACAACGELLGDHELVAHSNSPGPELEI